MPGVPVWFGLVPAILFVVDVLRGIAAVVGTKTFDFDETFCQFSGANSEKRISFLIFFSNLFL